MALPRHPDSEGVSLGPGDPRLLIASAPSFNWRRAQSFAMAHSREWPSRGGERSKLHSESEHLQPSDAATEMLKCYSYDKPTPQDITER